MWKMVGVAIVIVGLISGCSYADAANKGSQVSSQVSSQQSLMENKYESALALVNTSKWNEAKTALTTLNNYKDSAILLNFVNAKMAYANNDKQVALDYLNKIPTSYDGLYAGDTEGFRNTVKQETRSNPLWFKTDANLEQEQKQLMKENEKVIADTQAEINNKKNKIGKDPQIGWTSDEVLRSSWGQPEHINKTTTVNGVHEQWVYLGLKFIYFDSGKVTAIQDHN